MKVIFSARTYYDAAPFLIAVDSKGSFSVEVLENIFKSHERLILGNREKDEVEIEDDDKESIDYIRCNFKLLKKIHEEEGDFADPLKNMPVFVYWILMMRRHGFRVMDLLKDISNSTSYKPYSIYYRFFVALDDKERKLKS